MIKRKSLTALVVALDLVPRLAGTFDREVGRQCIKPRRIYPIEKVRSWAEKKLKDEKFTWSVAPGSASDRQREEGGDNDQWLEHAQDKARSPIPDRGGKQELKLKSGGKEDSRYAIDALFHCQRLQEIQYVLSMYIGDEPARNLVGLIASEATGIELALMHAGKLGWVSNYFLAGRNLNIPRGKRLNENLHWKIAEEIRKRIEGGLVSTDDAVKAVAKDWTIPRRKVTESLSRAHKLSAGSSSRVGKGEWISANWVPAPPKRGRPKKSPGR